MNVKAGVYCAGGHVGYLWSGPGAYCAGGRVGYLWSRPKRWIFSEWPFSFFMAVIEARPVLDIFGVGPSVGQVDIFGLLFFLWRR